MESHTMLPDDQFCEGLATGALDPALFNHEAHLRLAWLHLRKFGLKKSCESVPEAIRQYVRHLGKPEKFHLTLSVAAVNIVQHFMKKFPDHDFEALLQAEPRLKSHFPDLIRAHYRTDIYATPEARHAYLAPDRLPFPPIA